ncbi:hypothetical protein Taro_002090 [Colocasia esculenta]|uniref:Uncharacterized protein n=1 Tax=Colocasia esculenta TaxID=4460 RepID=A0A843TGA1_COLES|nr:hypothetical protein [Colocasia esculenta]
MDKWSSCRSTRIGQTTVEASQHHTCGPHRRMPMPGTFRDSGPSSLDWMYNSNIGVRVSRTDDTYLDGTTQVLGQAPSTKPGPHKTWGTQLKR